MIGIRAIAVNTISISRLLNVLDVIKNIVLNIVINVVGKDLFSFLDLVMKWERRISILSKKKLSDIFLFFTLQFDNFNVKIGAIILKINYWSDYYL